jgi:nucleoside-diphosphate-sugar epimerase
LSAVGHDVLAVTRRAGSLSGTAATEHVADVASRARFLASLDGVSADAVITLLGAGTELPDGFREMRVVNRLRAEGTSTLIAAARLLGATRFVGASAYYGYGFGDHGDEPIDESAPFGEPDGTRNDAVQFAVLSSDQQVRAFGGVSLRFGQLYGRGTRAVPAVSGRWSGSLPVVHLDDAASAAVLALGQRTSRVGDQADAAVASRAPGTAYNIAADEPTTWRELQTARARADGFGKPVVLPDGAIRMLAPFSSQVITGLSLRLSSATARRDLGWIPLHPALDSDLAGARCGTLPSANSPTSVGLLP